MLSVLSSWVLPLTVTLIILFGFIRKVRVFELFKEGVSDGLKTVYGIFPTIVCFVVAVTMLRQSGALELLGLVMKPVAGIIGVPEEVIPLSLMSSVSGGGALSVFEGILKDNGPDSFVGQVASVLSGATETTFYAVSVYYSAVAVRDTGHTLSVGLLADFVCLVLSSVFVKLTL